MRPSTLEWLQGNWALLTAAAVGLVIILLVLGRLAGQSGKAQLRRVRRKLAAERGRYRRAEAVAARAERQVRKLEQQAERVKPRLLQGAREAREDAKALARIANDQLLIAENHVRRVIFEEFPPAKQQRLRAKYLPDKPPDRKPFTF